MPSHSAKGSLVQVVLILVLLYGGIFVLPFIVLAHHVADPTTCKVFFSLAVALALLGTLHFSGFLLARFDEIDAENATCKNSS